jgi:glycosyltransferase involved in cell wall biosynthesis
MRIVVGPYLPSSSGVGQYTLGLAHALLKAGFEVDLVGAGLSSLPNLGFGLVPLPYDPWWCSWVGGPASEQSVLRAWMSRASKHADCVHVTAPPAAPRDGEGPIIVSSVFNYQRLSDILLQVPKTESAFRGLLNVAGWTEFLLLDDRGIRRSNGIVLTTTAAQARVDSALGAKFRPSRLVRYVPPCTPNISLRRGGHDNGRVKLLFSERDLARPRNNLNMLLRALSDLPGEAQGRVTLTLAGRHLQPNQRRWIRSLRDSNVVVEERGWLGRDEYDQLLDETDIYISLRDIWEQASFGAIEALGHGAAVIGGSRECYSDIVIGKNSHLRASAGTPSNLPQLLTTLVLSPEDLREAKFWGRRTWETEFSPESVSSKLRDFYETLARK